MPVYVHICVAFMCIDIFACVCICMWRPKVDVGCLPWSISTVHILMGSPLNPELSALATVAHKLAPGIPWVGLPLTVVTGSPLHFWLAFYLTLGIRTPLTFTSVWPLPGFIPHTFEGAYGPSSALFLSLLASSKTYQNRQSRKITFSWVWVFAFNYTCFPFSM